jgi:CubicO group peptidase (beta-lactamase class C family)
MKRSRFILVTLVVIVPLFILGFLFATGDRGLFRKPMVPRSLEITRLPADETKRLGWQPTRLNAVFEHAATLSTDVMMIVTDAQVVGAFGNLEKPYNLHSVRKSFLSALIGQHIGSGEKQIPLDATLAELGIDDLPNPLTSLQKQATVLHLLKSMSGINHGAAAEEGLLAAKNRRLGSGENKPGTIWAYNNWDYNALTTIFEMRTGTTIANAFETGIAQHAGMQDFTPAAVSYIEAPDLSQHPAAMFQMSARDLVQFGELYLNKGVIKGQSILPEAWIDRITTDLAMTGEDGLSAGNGYLWWIPGPDSGLPKGTYWAKGVGSQALFVIPEWRTVIVHLSDMTEFFNRFFDLTRDETIDAEAALEQLALSCLQRSERGSDFCREDRFILRREFDKLISLIVAARRT